MEKSKCCGADIKYNVGLDTPYKFPMCSKCSKDCDILELNNTMQTDEEIKKEFIQGYSPVTKYGGIKQVSTLEEIANYWISKIKVLQEEYKKELLDKIEDYARIEFIKGTVNIEKICKDIYNIIK